MQFVCVNVRVCECARLRGNKVCIFESRKELEIFQLSRPKNFVIQKMIYLAKNLVFFSEFLTRNFEVTYFSEWEKVLNFSQIA